jgi:hypothetical protein
MSANGYACSRKRIWEHKTLVKTKRGRHHRHHDSTAILMTDIYDILYIVYIWLLIPG